jgi:type II secretory pathway pseudopilin PulG
VGSPMKQSERGITLIEVMISSFFLTVALLAVAMAMGQGIAASYTMQEQLIAKQKAQEALESVIMARNTQQIGFTQIQSTASGGVFLSGFQPIQGMGTDGIPNTADDTGPIENITFPGPDGILGTADDVTVSLTNYQRQITISTINLPNDTNPDPDIRRIDVDVSYVVRGVTKTVRVSSLVSRYS